MRCAFRVEDFHSWAIDRIVCSTTCHHWWYQIICLLQWNILCLWLWACQSISLSICDDLDLPLVNSPIWVLQLLNEDEIRFQGHHIIVNLFKTQWILLWHHLIVELSNQSQFITTNDFISSFSMRMNDEIWRFMILTLCPSYPNSERLLFLYEML